MPLSRTFYNSLQDDDGSNTVGTPVTKAFIDAIYDDVDAVVEGLATPWTPVDSSGAGLTLTTAGCWYLRWGRLVFLSMRITYPTTANGATAKIGGLPFQINVVVASGMTIGFSTLSDVTLLLRENETGIEPFGAGAAKTNANLSGAIFHASGIYLV